MRQDWSFHSTCGSKRHPSRLRKSLETYSEFGPQKVKNAAYNIINYEPYFGCMFDSVNDTNEVSMIALTEFYSKYCIVKIVISVKISNKTSISYKLKGRELPFSLLDSDVLFKISGIIIHNVLYRYIFSNTDKVQ